MSIRITERTPVPLVSSFLLQHLPTLHTNLHCPTIQTRNLPSPLLLHNIQELKARKAVHITATLFFAGLQCAMWMLSRLWLLFRIRMIRDMINGRRMVSRSFRGLVVPAISLQQVPATGWAVLANQGVFAVAESWWFLHIHDPDCSFFVSPGGLRR